MRRLIPAAIAVALLAAGCGNSEGGLDSVSVSGDKSPTLKVEKGFEATKTTTKVLKKGDGDKIAEDDVVTLDYVAVNGRTGKTFDNSFKAGTPMNTTIKSGAILPGFVKGLKDQKVGSRLLVAIPPKDGFGGAQEQLGIKADDTMVFLFDVVKATKVPTAASGAAKKLPDAVPQIKLDAKKQPAGFTKTGKTASKADAKKSISVAIKGDGPAIKAGQSVQLEYLGQIYPTGKVFDESWSRGDDPPRPVGAGGYIPCWDEQLIGQTIGSRVILVCPSDVAYGDKKDDPNRPPEIAAGDTLIFAVDLLAAF